METLTDLQQIIVDAERAKVFAHGNDLIILNLIERLTWAVEEVLRIST